MDPNQKVGDDFLPFDFHDNLDDEGNYVGEPYAPVDPTASDEVPQQDQPQPVADQSSLATFARRF